MLAAVDLPEVTAQPHCPALGSLSCRFGAVSWRREPLNGGHGTWAAGGVHGHPLAGIQGDLRVVTSDAGVLLRPLWGFQHGYNLYKGRRRQQILINSRSARQAPLQTGLPKNIQKNLDVARLAFFPAACNFPAVSPSPSGVLPLPCSRHLPPLPPACFGCFTLSHICLALAAGGVSSTGVPFGPIAAPIPPAARRC